MQDVFKIGEAPQTDLGTVASLTNAPEWVLDLAHWTTQPIFYVVLVLIMIWAMVWKGMALWKAARHGQLIWFIALLGVNTVGILEILYISFWQKKEKSKKKTK